MSKATQARLDRAEDELYAARAAHEQSVAQAARKSKCRRCGASPGGYVCAEADRIVFACTNYVEGD